MNFAEWYFDYAIPNNINRIFVEGGPGFGKTTLFKYIEKRLIDNYDDLGIIPIYIPAKQLISYKNMEEYILLQYARSSKGNIEDAFSFNHYRFLLMIDGINEVEISEAREKILYVLVDKIIQFDNVQIIISSRNTIEQYRDISKNFTKIALQKLNRKKVINYLIKDITTPPTSLIDVLCIPMMLSIYLKSANKSRYATATNMATVIDIYFSEQRETALSWRKRISDDEDGKTICFILDVFLPYLCRFGDYSFKISDLEKCVNIDYMNTAFKSVLIENHYDEIDDISTKVKKIKKYLRDDIQLVYERKQNDYLLIHQIYASFFQAKYIEVTMKFWLQNPITTPEFIYINDFDSLYSDNFLNSYNNSYKLFFHQIDHRAIVLLLHQRLTLVIGLEKELVFQKNLTVLTAKMQNILEDDIKNSFKQYFNVFEDNLTEFIEPFLVNKKSQEIINSKLKPLYNLDYNAKLILKLFRVQFPTVEEYFETKYSIGDDWLQQDDSKEVLATEQEDWNMVKSLYSYSKLLKWITGYFLKTHSTTKALSHAKNNYSSYLCNYPYTTREILFDLAFESITKALNLLQNNNTNQYYADIIYSIFQILQYKECSDLSGFDFSNLDLTSVILKNNIYSNQHGLKHTRFQNTVFSKNGILPQINFSGVPITSSRDFRLLWYTNEFFCIHYLRQKTVSFYFNGFGALSLGISGTYNFLISSSRMSYYNYNFLYIARDEKSVCAYNFLLNIGGILFTVNDMFEINSLRYLGWGNGGDSVTMIIGNNRYEYNLDGELINEETYDKELNLDNHHLRNEWSYISETKAEIEQNNGIKYLIGRRLTKKVINDNKGDFWETIKINYGAIGNTNFKLLEYGYNNEGTKIIALCQYYNTFCIKEWNTLGNPLNTFYPFGTYIKKVFFICRNGQYSVTCLGYDNKYYFKDEDNIYHGIDLPNSYTLIGPSFNGTLLYFSNGNNIEIFEITECKLLLKFSKNVLQILGTDNDIEYMIFYSNGFISFGIIDPNCTMSLYQLKQNEKFELQTIPIQINISPNYVYYLDSLVDKIIGLNFGILKNIEKYFKEANAINFRDTQEYFILNVSNQNKIVFSIPKLEKTIIYSTKDSNIETKFDNTIIYNCNKYWLLLNKDAPQKSVSKLLSLFPDKKILYINKTTFSLEVKNCKLNMNKFNEYTKNQLKSCGALEIDA